MSIAGVDHSSLRTQYAQWRASKAVTHKVVYEKLLLKTPFSYSTFTAWQRGASNSIQVAHAVKHMLAARPIPVDVDEIKNDVSNVAIKEERESVVTGKEQDPVIVKKEEQADEADVLPRSRTQSVAAQPQAPTVQEGASSSPEPFRVFVLNLDGTNRNAVINSRKALEAYVAALLLQRNYPEIVVLTEVSSVKFQLPSLYDQENHVLRYWSDRIVIGWLKSAKLQSSAAPVAVSGHGCYVERELKGANLDFAIGCHLKRGQARIATLCANARAKHQQGKRVLLAGDFNNPASVMTQANNLHGWGYAVPDTVLTTAKRSIDNVYSNSLLIKSARVIPTLCTHHAVLAQL